MRRVPAASQPVPSSSRGGRGAAAEAGGRGGRRLSPIARSNRARARVGDRRAGRLRSHPTDVVESGKVGLGSSGEARRSQGPPAPRTRGPAPHGSARPTNRRRRAPSSSRYPRGAQRDRTRRHDSTACPQSPRPSKRRRPTTRRNQSTDRRRRHSQTITNLNWCTGAAGGVSGGRSDARGGRSSCAQSGQAARRPGGLPAVRGRRVARRLLHRRRRGAGGVGRRGSRPPRARRRGGGRRSAGGAGRDRARAAGGLSPNGTTIRPHRKRVPGFDATFKAPKSASVLYAVSDDPRVQGAVIDAGNHAVRGGDRLAGAGSDRGAAGIAQQGVDRTQAGRAGRAGEDPSAVGPRRLKTSRGGRRRRSGIARQPGR